MNASDSIEAQRRHETLIYQLGKEVMEALHDADVVEISLNDDGKVWVERNGEAMAYLTTMSAVQGHTIISLVADSMGCLVTVEQPIVEGEFPLDGSRFEGMIPPVCRAPAFSLRKHCSTLIPLADYVQSGAMPASVRNTIEAAIDQHRNILVVGGTGSGKTTLVNGIIDEINRRCPQERAAILEDTHELQSNLGNTLFLRSSVHASMQTLVKACMRLRPDRILVGEVRGGEALDLLMAWNTGHPGGVCTVHANSAAAGLQRLEDLCSIVSTTPMQRLIGEAVDLIIFVQRTSAGRMVCEAAWCEGYDATRAQYLLRYIYMATAQKKTQPNMENTVMAPQTVSAPSHTSSHALLGITIMLATCLLPVLAHAGGITEFAGPVEQVVDTLRGPVGKSVSMFAIIMCGIAGYFQRGEDVGSLFKGFVGVVFLITLIAYSDTILTKLFSFSGATV